MVSANNFLTKKLFSVNLRIEDLVDEERQVLTFVFH